MVVYVRVYFECGGLEDFSKSNIKTRGEFGFIAVECFVSIEENIAVGRVICSG